MRPRPVVLLGLLASSVAGAQRAPASRAVALRARWSLAAGVGVSGPSEATNGAAGTSRRSGAVVQVAGARWVGTELAVAASAEVRDRSGSVTSRGERASAVVPVLVSALYYPTRLALGTSARPYAGLGAGAYVGTLAVNAPAGQRAIRRAAAGARLQAGVDVFASTGLKLGTWGAYDVVPRSSSLDVGAGRRRFTLGVSAGLVLGAAR